MSDLPRLVEMFSGVEEGDAWIAGVVGQFQESRAVRSIECADGRLGRIRHRRVDRLRWRATNHLHVMGNCQTREVSDQLGAVPGVDPETGHNFDDTKRYIDQLPLSAADKSKIYEGNAKRVYGRLAKQLETRNSKTTKEKSQ